MVTDRLSDRLFVTDRLVAANLEAEGTPPEKIRFVGNVMIDTLDANRAKAEELDVAAIINAASVDPARPAFTGGEYALMTLHRPSNVDTPETLASLVEFFTSVASRKMPLVWTLHPRTSERLQSFGLWDQVAGCKGLHLVKPLGYHELLRLNMDARVFFTDSGGLQEECCVLGTPCVTLRFNTERPVTLVEHGGVSRLVGNDLGKIREAYEASLTIERRPYRPPLWDGHTAERIVADLVGA